MKYKFFKNGLHSYFFTRRQLAAQSFFGYFQKCVVMYRMAAN